MSVAEQRYQAVLAVISDGLSVSQVAEKVGCRGRRCMLGWRGMRPRAWMGWWIGRYRPVSCPHQVPAEVEAASLELRRSRRYWGPLVFEPAKRRVGLCYSPVSLGTPIAIGVESERKRTVAQRL
jgi:hypothetical protein